jgi:hypothetical protein
MAAAKRKTVVIRPPTTAVLRMRAQTWDGGEPA